MAQKLAVQFRGCFTAVITPFVADGSGIDFARLAEQVKRQAAGGVTGVVFAGTTGESPTLREDEYRELVCKGTAMAHEAGILAVAGTGSNSTQHACELQEFAAGAGVDAALSVNPYYSKPTQEGLYRHFMMQADAAALPVMLYNIPGRTGVALTPDTVARLSKHPNIRAIKEATGSTDSAGEICVRAPGLALLSGDDAMTLPFASVGGVGVVSVVSNLLPERVSEMCRLVGANRWGDALAIHRELMPLVKALFAETNPIPLKGAMRLLGWDTGVLRLPMTEAGAGTVQGLERALAGVMPGVGVGVGG